MSEYVFPVSIFIHRKENYGKGTSNYSLFENLVQKKAYFEVNGIKMFASEEPFCCVEIMRLIRKARSIYFFSEIFCVDSSRSSSDHVSNSGIL